MERVNEMAHRARSWYPNFVHHKAAVIAQPISNTHSSLCFHRRLLHTDRDLQDLWSLFRRVATRPHWCIQRKTAITYDVLEKSLITLPVEDSNSMNHAESCSSSSFLLADYCKVWMYWCYDIYAVHTAIVSPQSLEPLCTTFPSCRG